MSAEVIIEAFGQRSGIFGLMNTAWAWPLAESLHFIGLSLLLGTIGIVDLKLLGFVSGVSFADLHRLTRFGIAGFALNAITGFAFFVSAPDQYLYNPAFQLKVLCMAIAGVNVAAFYLLTWPRFSRSGTQGTSAAARLSGLISLAAWLSVIAFGRLITFYRPPEHWCFWCPA